MRTTLHSAGLIRLSDKGRTPAERLALERAHSALDAGYDFARKVRREAELETILTEFIERLQRAFGSVERARGKRILDIACGSNSSRSPDTGERTAMFEPWFCRLLFALGADPVGVDAGDLEGERFEHHVADLSRIGASGTKNTPSWKSSSSSAAACSASRVLPVPPGPVSVSRRVSS